MSTQGSGNILLVIGVLIALVVLANGGMILLIMRGRGANPFQGFFEGIKRLRNPWEEEEQQLEELKQKVANLKSDSHEEAPPES